MEVDLTLSTDGNGLWSSVERSAVKIFNVILAVPENNNGELASFGELKVYFDTSTWLVEEDGLIYTDETFAKELNAFLATKGLPKVYYSEQGMQGEDFVSFDVDGEFIVGWGLAGQEVLV